MFIYLVKNDYKMQTLSLKLDDELVNQLDFLVKTGRFRSRNAVLRKLIKSGLERESALVSSKNIDIEKILSFVKILKNKQVQLNIVSEKSAAELVAEGRER